MKANKIPGCIPLLLVSLLTLLPLFLLIGASLKSYPGMTAVSAAWLPTDAHWENNEIFSRFPVWRYVANTLIIAGGQVAGALLGISIVAWGFGRYPGRWNRLLFAMLLAIFMLPWQIAAIPVFSLFVRLGLPNTYLLLIFPGWLGCGVFGVFLLNQFFQGIPTDLFDAARMDGASEWQVFYRIAVPLCRPVLWIIALFALINSWNDCFGPLIYLFAQRRP